jgi:Zn-dependent peptidase ImmA (M78 family)
MATMRQADLERRASELLATHGVAGPPVPVERVAQGEGARIARRPFDDGDLSGMLYREPKGPAVIAVNARNAPTRQRFTIAHEIAHLLLHEPTLQVDRPISGRFRDERSALAVDRDEIEANQFAAALLMKREWVLDDAQQLLRQHPELPDEEVVRRLADRYEVSRQAMEFRLANLGLWTPL